MKKIYLFFWAMPFTRNLYLSTCFFMTHLLLNLRLYYWCGALFCFNYRLIYNDKKRNDLFSKKILSAYDDFFKNKLIHLFKDKNQFYNSFLKTKRKKITVQEFSQYGLVNMLTLRYPKENDHPSRLGDMMVLKRFNPQTGEKGVVALHYNEAFLRFVSLYDVDIFAKKYIIVLEPSWWGYQKIDILVFLSFKTPIVIQCPYSADYQFIDHIGENMLPIRLGAGDWVDNERFKDGRNEKKLYDIVSIGNWSKIKRHEVLFQAMRNMKEKAHVALIGYPHHGRSSKDVIREANSCGVANQITLFENISADEVSRILRQSKVNVLLSKGEGANRGIYEGLFSGNVLVLYRHNRGVNAKIINDSTGFYADEDELGEVLDKAVQTYSHYRTAAWATENTGYKKSSMILNDFLKTMVERDGQKWTVDIVEKVNRPNNRYLTESKRLEMYEEITSLQECLQECLPQEAGAPMVEA